jgi:hypothetical protein
MSRSLVTDYYVGFNYRADQISKFKATVSLFTVLLKTGEIVHFDPDDPAAFRQWLVDNGIEDIK